MVSYTLLKPVIRVNRAGKIVAEIKGHEFCDSEKCCICTERRTEEIKRINKIIKMDKEALTGKTGGEGDGAVSPLIKGVKSAVAGCRSRKHLGKTLLTRQEVVRQTSSSIKEAKQNE